MIGVLHTGEGKESAHNAGDAGSTTGWEDPLEEEMAVHSSIFAWEIPWTEEPGRLQWDMIELLSTQAHKHAHTGTSQKRSHTVFALL